MDTSYFAPTPELNGLPAEADFSPGTGLTLLTRTNPNALAASGDLSQNTPVRTTVSANFFTSPIGMALCVGLAILVVHKLWSERKGDSHVADFRIGATPLLIMVVVVAVARHLGAAGAGVYTKLGGPGADRVTKFLTL